MRVQEAQWWASRKRATMNSLVKVIDADDETQWLECLAQVGEPDILYFPEYLSLYAQWPHAKPQLFVYQSKSGRFVYAVNRIQLDRFESLDQSSVKNSAFITSPYGYGGPLVQVNPGGNRGELVTSATVAFSEWCRDTRVIAEFCRYHPLLQNHDAAPRYGSPEPCGETIFIDLRQSQEEIFEHFRENHRRAIRNAIRVRVEVLSSRKLSDVDRFLELYEETLQRKHTSSIYFFDRECIEATVALPRNSARLYLARIGDRVIGANIFLFGARFAYYHLSGTRGDFLRFSPNKFLIYRACIDAKNEGLEAMLLGGGVGARNDSLLLFKRGFSKTTAPYFVGKYVHDGATYRGMVAAAGSDPSTAFFPAFLDGYAHVP